jgi:hypothetical protein
MPGLESWLLARIDKVRRRLELTWSNHGTLIMRELSTRRDMTNGKSQCCIARPAPALPPGASWHCPVAQASKPAVSQVSKPAPCSLTTDA